MYNVFKDLAMFWVLAQTVRGLKNDCKDLDVGQLSEVSLEECMAACDQQHDCGAFTYAWNSCFMKQLVIFC